MVKAVASGTVDERVVGDVLAIVNQNGPDLDEDEKQDIGPLLKGEQKGVDVVRQRLGPTVDGVEGNGGVGGGHDPFVVSLVQVLVDKGVVKAAMDPVDAEVGEHEEERELSNVVPHARAVLGGVVHLGVAADLEEEEGHGEDGHAGDRRHGLLDLQGDLVLQVAGVLEGLMIKDKVV